MTGFAIILPAILNIGLYLLLAYRTNMILSWRFWNDWYIFGASPYFISNCQQASFSQLLRALLNY
jgi:hypothetical protein